MTCGHIGMQDSIGVLMSQHGPDLSVVVPVFNSDRSLFELVERFRNVLRGENVESWELIFVDDGSSNHQTWPILSELSDSIEDVRAFRLSRNFGKAGAVLCGLSHVRGAYVLTIDDDLEQRPEDFRKLWNEREHDVVIGSFSEKAHGVLIRLSSRIKAWFDRILVGKPKDVRFTPYKLYKRYVVDSMVAMKTPYPFISALMIFVTKDIVNVEVGHARRKHGRVGFTFRKRLKQFMSLLINNSSLLLQMIALFGVGLSSVSLVYGGVVVYRAVADDIAIAGWPSLMVAVLFIGGAILFSLGVIGEYLIRIIKGVEKKPAFIVKERK